MEEHKKTSPLQVKVGIITLSDSKYKDIQESKNTDLSGEIIKKSLKGHEIVSYKIIPDDEALLLENIDEMRNKGAEVIICTGGTGIGKRDITIEAIQPLFGKELPGFGEIFRSESYKELGTGAMLSRATAGIYKDVIVFALPGSPNAVTTGMKIIKPELGHLVKHLNN